jgi:hypothetical protein
MKSLYRCVAGLDVHRMLYVLTVMTEPADDSLSKETLIYKPRRG